MKNLFVIAIMILLVSCSKEEAPQPIVTQPNPPTTQSTLCDGVYLYEVTLSNPLGAGDRVDVIWTESDGNVTGYEQMTTTVVMDTSVTITTNPYNIYNLQLSAGLVGGDPNQTIQNTVTLTIYDNTGTNVLVTNTIPVCFQGTMSSTSCSGTNPTGTIVYTCI